MGAADQVSLYFASSGCPAANTDWLLAPVATLTQTGQQFATSLHGMAVPGEPNDLYVGAPYYEVGGQARGAVYRYSVAELSTLGGDPQHVPAYTRYEGTYNNGLLGWSLLAMDRDSGGPVLLAGLPGAIPGQVDVLDAELMTLQSSITDPAGSFPASMNFGIAMTAGDFNGDGSTDLAVGEGGLVSGVNVFDGASNFVDSVFIAAAVDGDLLGSSLAAVDVDADGYDDLIAGAFRARGAGGGGRDNGQFQIWRGNNTSGGQFAVTQIRKLIHGETQRDMLGYSVGGGDFNGDGYGDVAVGAPDVAEVGYRPDSGYLHIYYAGGDGVVDGLDNCPDVNNTDQLDLDNDGEGDACDTDIDGDNVDNDIDTCPLVADASNLDTDGDGDGDVCDDDIDNDGYANADDLDPTDAGNQRNSDADALPDHIESEFGLRLTSEDTDGDGLWDDEEVVWDGSKWTAISNPRLADSDGDGLDDSAEADLNTNPNDSPPTVSISFPDEYVEQIVGVTYNIQASASDAEDGDLTDAIRWFVDGVDSGQTGATFSYTTAFGYHTVMAYVADSSGTGSFNAQTAAAQVSFLSIDITGTPVFNISSLLKVQRYLSGEGALTPTEFETFDIYPPGGDGAMTVSDLLMLEQILLIQ